MSLQKEKCLKLHSCASNYNPNGYTWLLQARGLQLLDIETIACITGIPDAQPTLGLPRWHTNKRSASN